MKKLSFNFLWNNHFSEKILNMHLKKLQEMHKFQFKDIDKSCKSRFYIILHINSFVSTLNLKKTY
jgi:hypothetical protein